MVQRFLITTADERTWMIDQPVLFLGEWCRLYERREVWQGLDAEVVPYHWDNREKYYRDYTYLQDIYESVLSCTGDALNQFHATKHSRRYWRILIGPWLYMFVHVLFDRWTMIQEAAHSYEIGGTVILDQADDAMIPGNMIEFQRLVWGDEWNHFILGKVIRKMNQFPWVLKKTIPRRRESNVSSNLVRKPFKRKLIDKTTHFLTSFSRNNEVFIIQNSMPRFQEMLLQLRLGQLPKLWLSPTIKHVTPDFVRRQSFGIDAKGGDDFVKFVFGMVSQQIPVVYLEAYSQLVAQTQELPWPSKPSVVFTDNAYESDEVFKLWTAEKTEKGVPLVIGQHGGFFGAGKWAVGEDHQVEIADRFLTWGWSDSRKAVFPAVALTNLSKPCGKWNHDGHLLLVTVPIARYCWKSSSWPTAANQSERFIGDQLRFAGLLTSEIRRRLIVRLYKQFDDMQKTSYWTRWEKACPEAVIDPSTGSIEPLMRNCRIFVSTYNATTFLSSLGRNIPTIMFWNPAYMELRNSANPYFERLKQVGIFHETPESAATKVQEIWDDVAGWWEQDEVQKARTFFCYHFARMPEKPVNILMEALNTVQGCKGGLRSVV